ncbi:MAG: beta-propeller domain-containing protein [Thermoplasmata archaeon]|nr:beta-propeller domain-containing protein [Thermoplasmata archaeon]
MCIAATVLVSGMIMYAFAKGSEDRPNTGDGMLISFSSKHELADFLMDSESSVDGSAYYSEDMRAPTSTGDYSLSEAGSSYSTTNVQVAGVDEADMVKTDGEYIYVSSYSSINIIKAYPSDEMVNVTSLDLLDMCGYSSEDMSIYVSGLYLFQEKLVVVWNLNYHMYLDHYADSTEYLYTIIANQVAMVSVLDVSNVYDPVLEFSSGVTGYGLTSRVVDGNLYLVAQMYTWMVDGVPYIPHLWVDGASTEFAIDDVLFDPGTPDASSYINLLSVDILSGESQCKAIMGGYASVVYMSQDALYLTIPKWTGYVFSVDSAIEPIEEWTARTSIYKIAIDDLSMVAVAGGEVKGWLLDQFSMDECEGYLRVATTTSWSEPENAVYVMNSDLDVVGSLEDIAPTEWIFSARFMGETLYLVTFRQVDPLFVIDLSDPSAPEIVGELKVPGFSSYLHPVGTDHVLGIGSENGSVKVTLFNVSDPTTPVEQSTFLVGSYSWTVASYDHKAVLFDLEREMLVLPMSVYAYDPNGTYSSWTGAYVFTVSLIEGISLNGIISHDEVYTYDWVVRSLYIEDSLYTVSYYTIKASSLSDLSEEAFLLYSALPDYYFTYAEGVRT